MENSVYVAGDEFGNIITVSKNNPEFGWITLKQDSIVVHNGWANNRSLSAIIMGKVSVLEQMNHAAGQILDGNIVVVESLKPFTSEDRDVKLSGPNGIPCTYQGQTIYRKTFYTDNPDARNILISHDNADEIRAFNAHGKSSIEDLIKPKNSAPKPILSL